VLATGHDGCDTSHDGKLYATLCKSAVNPHVSSEEGTMEFLVFCLKVMDSLEVCYIS
jgi:hypothetical protein